MLIYLRLIKFTEIILTTYISVRLFDKTKNTGVMYTAVFICTETMNT